MSEETPVLTEVRGPILIITLNRPEAKNAANLALSKGVAAAIDRLDADDTLSVGIITGAGGTFCSGMDLKGFLKGERPSIPGRGFAGLTEAPPKKPLIAAVDGYALAGGMEAPDALRPRRAGREHEQDMAPSAEKDGFVGRR